MIMGFDEFESLIITIIFYDGHCEILIRPTTEDVIEYADPNWLEKLDRIAAWHIPRSKPK